MMYTHQFSSVTQSCPILCHPMNSSTPGLPVRHQLLEFTQTHVHRVGDSIQPSHPLLSPSSPAPNPSQHQGLFQWVNSSHEVAKVLEFQLQHHPSNVGISFSLFSFWEPYMWMLASLILPQYHLKWSHFLIFFFIILLFWLDNFHDSSWSHGYSSLSPSLLFISSSMFFISVTAVLRSDSFYFICSSSLLEF